MFFIVVLFYFVDPKTLFEELIDAVENDRIHCGFKDEDRFNAKLHNERARDNVHKLK